MSIQRRVVFDSNIFLQAALNPNGPANRCLDACAGLAALLVYHDFILAEFHRTASTPKLRRKNPQLTDRRVTAITTTVISIGERHERLPSVFYLKRDPDDSLYIDLAIDARATFVVSRDNDLLTLRDPTHPDGREFLTRYPDLLILDPVAFLQSLDTPLP